MRLVHTRKKIFDNDKGWSVFSDKYALLLWYLSAIQAKRLGHTVVMYTDDETLKRMKSVYLDRLYDEINTEVYKQEFKGINFRDFWALPKIYAYMNELENFDDTVMIDTDLVLFKNPKFKNADVTVWGDKEYVAIEGIYCKLRDVSLPLDYTLPKWFNEQDEPLNTGIIYFRNKDKAKEYCNEVIRFSTNNNNSKGNTQSQLMCFAEQRLIGSYISGHKMAYTTVQPVNEGVYNKNGFHALVHKYDLSRYPNKMKDAVLSMLLMIRDLNSSLFKEIIKLELFKAEKEALKLLDINTLELYKKLKASIK